MLLTAGDPRRRTGGNRYDARIARAARASGLDLRRVVADRPSRAAREIRAQSPRVLVVDSIAFGRAPGLVRAAPGARVVALAHMSVSGRAARSLLERADVAVAVSRPLARELRALGASRVVVIPPGRDAVPRRPRATSRGPIRLLCVANWSRVKGIDVLAHACARMEAVRLVLAGEEGRGAYAARVRRTLGSLGDVARRGGVGPRELAGLYASADVVVVPSRAEGYGIVAAEAIDHGLPLIASDLPPLRAIVGAAGALVRPGDVTALAAAIGRARDPATRRRWARAARRRRARLWRWRTTERTFVALLEAELHALPRGGERMPPRGVKSPKRRRQYEKIKQSALKRGRSPKVAKRIAAATTNKTRRRKGETKSSSSRTRKR